MEDAQRDALIEAADHLFRVRVAIRDMYAVYQRNSYIYINEGAREAVEHTYQAEDFVNAMLKDLDTFASR